MYTTLRLSTSTPSFTVQLATFQPQDALVRDLKNEILELRKQLEQVPPAFRLQGLQFDISVSGGLGEISCQNLHVNSEYSDNYVYT